MILLGVNIDHVATLRQTRGTDYPNPVDAALVAEAAGADFITVHLREDRRHIQDRDVVTLGKALTTRMNLEAAVTPEMIRIARRVRPHDVCLVPERRAELTTEGGLDVARNFKRIERACRELSTSGVRVSLFIDAEPRQIDAAERAGAPVVELHSGRYAEARSPGKKRRELEKLQAGAAYAASKGLQVNAGHGLNYLNVQPIAAIGQIRELNIGHSIVARSVFVGMAQAVHEMKALIGSA